MNALSVEAFIQLFEGIYEKGEWIQRKVAQHRPFSSHQQLFACMKQVVDNLTNEDKIRLLCDHPDLAGRAAEKGTLSAASTAEQKGAGLNALDDKTRAQFRQNNQAYKDKFQFPFIICVKENKVEGMLRGFAERLGHSPAEELEIAVSQVHRIAELRFLAWQNPAKI